MKKYIILLITSIILSNCEIRVKQANSQIIHTIKDSNGHSDVYVYRYREQGMEYRIFHTGYGHGGTSVVNLTKDSLEVELLKRQLNK